MMMDYENIIREIFEESASIKTEISGSHNVQVLVKMGEEIAEAVCDGKKLMLCGNGGSAADAQHLAAEMLVRLRSDKNRSCVPAITLAQDTSTITACGNDLGYEILYERMVQGLGKEGDVLIAITTSGNSENVIRAMKMARKLNIKVFGFLGKDGGSALQYCDEAFVVPSDNTARIQEAHITAGHALMENVEDRLLGCGYLV